MKKTLRKIPYHWSPEQSDRLSTVVLSESGTAIVKVPDDLNVRADQTFVATSLGRRELMHYCSELMFKGNLLSAPFNR